MNFQQLIDSEEYFQKIKQYDNIVVYGAGNKARETVKLLEQKGIYPDAVCDGNQALWGKEFLGKYRVSRYEEMKKRLSNYCILICTTINTAVQIIEELRAKGETAPMVHVSNLFKVDSCLLNTNEIKQDFDRYAAVYDLLEDDLSKTVYVHNLNSKITGNLLPLYELMDGETFFDKKILGQVHPHEVYVDAGAYTGDTLCRFIAYSGGEYEKAIAFEPDESNFQALKNFVKYGVVERTRLVNVGLWSERAKKQFYTVVDNSELYFGSPNLFRKVEDIADNSTMQTCNDQSLNVGAKEVITDCLDNLLEDENPTLIKVNALAADLPILQGCEKTLKRCVPDIVMEYGVRPDYLLGEIEFLNRLNLGYRFYMRQKNIFHDSKTVLYAISDKRAVR